MSTQFFTLTVSALDKPIETATTISFDVPTHLYEQFDYQPGQHLVIKFKIEGKEVRRSYSLNSSPFLEEQLQVTVKRVKDGLVSNFVNDQLQVGDTMEVMLPQGRFYANIQKEAYKTYFLFAAGSGITPIISIAKSVLVASPNSMVHLFYGNSNQDTIIFKKELEELEKTYSERFNLVQTLSSPKVWSTWEQWKGRKGRIDTANIEWFIENHPPIAQSTEYYACGPGAMNVAVKNTLINLGVPKNLIHIEQFGGQTAEATTNIQAIPDAQLLVQLNGQQHELVIPEGKTVLSALKAASLEPPFSCESGVCGTCVATLHKGTAEMKSCMALEDDDIKKGLILTCQALPTSEKVELRF